MILLMIYMLLQFIILMILIKNIDQHFSKLENEEYFHWPINNHPVQCIRFISSIC
jgi:hypothetical protein